MRHLFHPAARAELLASIRYYEAQKSGLGRRFLESVTEAIPRIEAHPNMYRAVAGTWRQCRVPRFPFGIIYRVKRGNIEIVAVMHLHRDPGYGRNRTIDR